VPVPTEQTQNLDQLREDIEFETTLRDRNFRFHSTWGLFSPREIDVGTHLLLDRIEVSPTDDCLDIGCGYGAIGLTLALLAPEGRTLLVDKDFVAVEYAEKNARANAIDNAEALLSNGLAQVPTDREFNLVATNLPAKIGNELTTLIVADAWARLRPGGRLYLVTLSGMRKFIQRVIHRQCGTYEKVKQGGIYTLHRAVKPPTEA
jgi:16S rRNA (guanine1207-N2)-methyltransferase